jgi:proline iminopeptidase
MGIDSWVVWGGSWGSTLALAYAERHPDRVAGLVLGPVTLTRPEDIDWLYRGVGRFLPVAFEHFSAGADHAPDLLERYGELLEGSDGPERQELAAAEWCRWEDAVVSLEEGWRPQPRFADPEFRRGFARLCAHYFRQRAWLGPTQLLEGASRLAGIPGELVHGRFDLGSPVEPAHLLARAWAGSRLTLVDTGHQHGSLLVDELVSAIDRVTARLDR